MQASSSPAAGRGLRPAISLRFVGTVRGGGVHARSYALSDSVDWPLRTLSIRRRHLARLENLDGGQADARPGKQAVIHEMKGDWYPGSPTVDGFTPGSYVGTWRHVHDQFEQRGLG